MQDMHVVPQVQAAPGLEAGILLVANPLRFYSRNPFSRPVNNLGRFGLQVCSHSPPPMQALPVAPHALCVAREREPGSNGLEVPLALNNYILRCAGANRR